MLWQIQQYIHVCVCVCLQEMSPGEVTLEGLLDMSEEQVCELLQKFGANEEECARLNASLSCLRKAHQLGKRSPENTRRSAEMLEKKHNFSIFSIL